MISNDILHDFGCNNGSLFLSKILRIGALSTEQSSKNTGICKCYNMGHFVIKLIWGAAGNIGCYGPVQANVVFFPLQIFIILQKY